MFLDVPKHIVFSSSSRDSTSCSSSSSSSESESESKLKLNTSNKVQEQKTLIKTLAKEPEVTKHVVHEVDLDESVQNKKNFFQEMSKDEQINAVSYNRSYIIQVENKICFIQKK